MPACQPASLQLATPLRPKAWPTISTIPGQHLRRMLRWPPSAAPPPPAPPPTSPPATPFHPHPTPPPPPRSYQDYNTTASGLQYKDLRDGEGEPPANGDTAVVDWSGYTIGYYGRPFEARNKVRAPAGLGWAGLGWAGLGWAGLGWAGLGWAGLGWAGPGRAGPGPFRLAWAGPGRAAPARRVGRRAAVQHAAGDVFWLEQPPPARPDPRPHPRTRRPPAAQGLLLHGRQQGLLTLCAGPAPRHPCL
jgi:hypothetical protein